MRDEQTDELLQVDGDGNRFDEDDDFEVYRFVDEAGDEDEEGGFYDDRENVDEDTDVLTPIAERYAKNLHKMPVSGLIQLGKYDEVRALYDLALDELSRR